MWYTSTQLCSLPNLPVKSFKSIANFQPGPITQDDTTTPHRDKQITATKHPAHNQEEEATSHESQTDQHQDEEAQLPQQGEGERARPRRNVKKLFKKLFCNLEGKCGTPVPNYVQTFILCCSDVKIP